ncbi:UrcA family protein [Hyphococcus sp.]|uniref:UrcA family protein n=1 Tax=Hyphococcus sp. TaxID=2038636 RepID=UPI0020812CA9|nr:MAG: hypothetical protein DHS20C04_03570 [Marinicaulis sp.]
MPRTKPLNIVAITALSTFAAVGAANASSINNHAAFGYKASELQTTASVQSLYRRIESKAGSACGVKNARALYAKKISAQCESDLVEDWVQNIGDARLRQTHAQAKSARNFAAMN